MTAAEKKFWRLLGDYETLTRDQTSLLLAKEWNYPHLGELLRKKGLIFEELLKTGRRLGINRNHPGLRKRLDALEQTERENEAKVRASLEALQNDRDELRLVSTRLQSLERTYVTELNDKRVRFYAKV